MPLPKEQAWFPAKTYGWGWGVPKRWQGWVVGGGFVVGLVFPGIRIASRSIPYYAAYAIALSIVLSLFCYWKGERPRWRWGDDK
ncbi:MAG TPA: hypothetical protein VGM64_07995 [Lacunisphaera sp.]